MVASILNNDKLTISNVPNLSDSITMANLLRGMGSEVELSGGKIHINSQSINRFNSLEKTS